MSSAPRHTVAVILRMQPYKRLIIVHHEPSRKNSDFRQNTATDKTDVLPT